MSTGKVGLDIKRIASKGCFWGVVDDGEERGFAAVEAVDDAPSDTLDGRLVLGWFNFCY